MLAMADPVVTLGGGVLRFEGFSRCCSAYGRVDLLPDAHEGREVRHGTTNVDFSQDLRGALAGLRARGRLGLAVADNRLELRGDAPVVERRIPLPRRWLAGFLCVSAYARRLERQLAMLLPGDEYRIARSAAVGGEEGGTWGSATPGVVGSADACSGAMAPDVAGCGVAAGGSFTVVDSRGEAAKVDVVAEGSGPELTSALPDGAVPAADVARAVGGRTDGVVSWVVVAPASGGGVFPK